MADPTPFHLQGNFAPIKDEITTTDLEVVGTIPPELEGLYVRNGANPPSGYSQHWFLGQGMVHGVRLEGGRAASYRNRYVRTPYLENPDLQRVSETGQIDRTASAANTHVIEHAGKLLALEEGKGEEVLHAVGTSGGGERGEVNERVEGVAVVTGEDLRAGSLESGDGCADLARRNDPARLGAQLGQAQRGSGGFGVGKQLAFELGVRCRRLCALRLAAELASAE